MFDAGSHGGFASVVVVPNVLFDDYNRGQMRGLADIMFAESPAPTRSIQWWSA